MTKPKARAKRISDDASCTTDNHHAASNDATTKGSTCAPNIEWAKNPDWTWSIITYLTDHTAFRTKLFSDSTANAAKEGRAKHVGKDGKNQQYAVLAEHIFATEPTQSKAYKVSPSRFTTSVETRLQR
jgi:hypothetical protein